MGENPLSHTLTMCMQLPCNASHAPPDREPCRSQHTDERILAKNKVKKCAGDQVAFATLHICLHNVHKTPGRAAGEVVYQHASVIY
jgi:hypothetical protein